MGDSGAGKVAENASAQAMFSPPTHMSDLVTYICKVCLPNMSDRVTDRVAPPPPDISDLITHMVAGEAHLRRLGRTELLVLLELRAHPEPAQASQLQFWLGFRAAHRISLGTICKTLHRLEAKHYALSAFSSPQPFPGGRRRRLYRMTDTGGRALAATLEAILRSARPHG